MRFFIVFVICQSLYGQAALIGQLITDSSGEITYTVIDDQTANNANIGGSAAAIAYAYDPSEAGPITRVALMCSRDGAATGTFYVALYRSATPGADDVPDDLVGAAVGLDASTLPDESPATALQFWYPSSWPSMDSGFYQIVHWFEGTGTITLRIQTSGNAGYFTRSAGIPNATDDAVNWTETDTNGTMRYQTSKSP